MIIARLFLSDAGFETRGCQPESEWMRSSCHVLRGCGVTAFPLENDYRDTSSSRSRDRQARHEAGNGDLRMDTFTPNRILDHMPWLYAREMRRDMVRHHCAAYFQ